MYRGFVGGRGSGKSWIGAYDLIRRAKPGRTYFAGSPTYRALEDYTWKAILDIGHELGVIADYAKTRMGITLGNGAKIYGRSADDPDKSFRGPNLSGAWLDEASQMSRDAFDLIAPALREGGELGWLSCTFTPNGRSHWTYDVFASERKHPRAQLFRASTKQNPFLHADLYSIQKANYSPIRARQELEGEFVEMEGAEWPSDWFDDDIWFDEFPRHWTAKVVALDPSKGKDAKTGDYCAFVYAMYSDGVVWVDAELGRWNMSDIAERAMQIQRSWQPDLFGVEVVQFQELLADDISRLCATHNVLWPRCDIESRINKQVRIRTLTPWLNSRGGSQPRQMRFRANSPGASLLVEQLREFPVGEHDDGPDALDMAMRTMNIAIDAIYTDRTDSVYA